MLVCSCRFSARCTSVILSIVGLMVSPPGEVAKALDTDRALMPEAGEGFDFTSYLECVARVCREKKIGKTTQNYGVYL
jgi:hypothetical protein